MEKVQLEVVTPSRVVLKMDVDMVVLPGTEGEFGVLPGHVPFLAGILPGEMRYTVESVRGYLAVSSGFAEVFDNRVSVLVDAAEKAEDIDLDRARRALVRAKERLRQDRSNKDIDFLRAEGAIRRAVARLKVAEKAGIN